METSVVNQMNETSASISSSRPGQDNHQPVDALSEVLLSILITNWNTCDYLLECLHSLETTLFDSTTLAQVNSSTTLTTAHGFTCEVIIVDNASSDGSAEMVREKYPWARLVVSQQNLGFGGGCNLGAQLARGAYFLILNPDVILFNQSINGLLEFLQSTPQAGAAGPRILNPDQTLQVSIYQRPTLAREAWRLFHLDSLYPLSQYPPSVLNANHPKQVDVLMGACLLIRRSVANQVGLFDERFFMYSEEVDLCRRIQLAGWKLYWLPDVRIIHYGGQSTRQVADQMFIELYHNKLNYFRKHHCAPQWITVGIYKAILLCAAVVRWLFGSILAVLPLGHLFRTQRQNWKTLARQYGHLITRLPQL